MIERLVFRAITDGIARLKADPDELLSFFECEALLEKKEATEIRDYFLANTPSVIHGYARADAKFPLYAIMVTAESQSDKFIGDEGGFMDDPADPEFGTDELASIWDYTLNIVCYSQHPDVTLYNFQLLKNIMAAALPFFKNDDYFDITLSGADMAPDSATMPAGLFLRRLQFNARRQFTQPLIGSKLGRAWTLSGLFIDREGAQSEDVGDVRTNVRVNAKED